MTTRTDSELLNLYAQNGDPDAFNELAQRYIHLVHAAATRQTRDPHLADDVAQAVFMVLARRARELRNHDTLAGWLILTTRNAALAALKANLRRRLHEQKAVAMKDSIQPPEDDSHWLTIDGLLDSALAKLNDRDRDAICMHYFQGKKFVDIAAVLGISEDAASKRTSRAIEKLRDYFTRRGVSAPSEVLSAALLVQASHLAPASLTATVGSQTSIPLSASAIANSIMKGIATTQTKLIAACAATIVVATSIAIPLYRNHPASTEAAPVAVVASIPVAPPVSVNAPATIPTSNPIAFRQFPIPNVLFANIGPTGAGTNNQYTIGVDPTTRRTDTAAFAGYIKSMQANALRGDRQFILPQRMFVGQRVRITGWLKSRDVARFGGMHVLVYGTNGHVLADDDMCGRSLSGTTDWEQYQMVVDLPGNTGKVDIRSYLQGTGELWSDGFVVEAVSNDVATTDDQNWHIYSPYPKSYSAKQDRFELHNGHPTTCVSGKNPPRGSWANYDHVDRHPDKYLGKRIHISAWVKCERLTSTAGLMIQVIGLNFRTMSTEGQRGDRPIKGTSDWTQYHAFADVPEDAHSISTGLTMNGGGKMWVDDIQYEVLETPK